MKEVKHKYYNLGFNFATIDNIERTNALSKQIDMIFDVVPEWTRHSIGSKEDFKKSINDILQIEIERASKTQIVDIPAVWLREGDLILDYHNKTIQRVEYVSSYDATMEDKKPNTILVSYGENSDCDNFNIDATVSIVINPVTQIAKASSIFQ